MVPFAHMQKLRSISKAPTTWLENANSGHMDAYVYDKVTYWETIQKFWRDEVMSQASTM